MSESPRVLPPGRLVVWSARVYLGLALGAVAWLGLRDGAIPLALFVNPETWALDLGTGLGAAVLMLAGWQAAVWVLPSARDLERRLSEILGPLASSEVFTLALLSGFAEELFFRGAVQSQFGWIAATALFGLLHIGPGREYRLWTAFALASGALLGGLVLWRGNLLAAVVAHVAINQVGLTRLRKLAPGAPEEAD